MRVSILSILVTTGLSLFLTSGNILNARSIIHAGHVIHPDKEKSLEKQSIIIEAGKIQAIKSGFVEAAEGDKVIDLSDSWVLPGMIDMHTHLSFEYNRLSQMQRFTLNEADYAIASTEYAKRTLLAGFTAVRDLGDAYNATIALSRAINAGLVEGPRVYTAGKSIATTGGHADPTNGIRKDLSGNPGPKQGVVNSPDEARRAVRQRYKDGSDLIKITATGGILSVAKSGQNPQFTNPELKAIIETANDYGMKVAAHAHGSEGMKRAILAGVDSIEHGTYMTDEIMRLMIKKGTYLVPTITAGKWVAQKSEIAGFFPEIIRPKAASIGPKIVGVVKKAIKKGVKVAFGTDTGVSTHGKNAQEFAYLVEAGMTPMEAIQSATVEAAKLLGTEDGMGRLAAGYHADIVASKQNPLKNIKALEDISFVMKAGEVYLNKSGKAEDLSH